ncbi:hypothetical protein EG328_002878 [Venturia inaequalis]|uniref:Uncharacterized protein n=1 Tax=Venturia inaequalis TaxID=5025 RepID=A0A8H3URX6_VENIN|nr:hypothetical protein EG328_002878 [Venturia inaequalis]
MLSPLLLVTVFLTAVSGVALPEAALDASLAVNHPTPRALQREISICGICEVVGNKEIARYKLSPGPTIIGYGGEGVVLVNQENAPNIVINSAPRMVSRSAA